MRSSATVENPRRPGTQDHVRRAFTGIDAYRAARVGELLGLGQVRVEPLR
ncbi:hypothetical protein ACVGVM_17190 [Pseudonocardia bannensis]|uniref:Uncharacterized protein n=1 Tax=Pseudonocardia bannensis TaxID=630973 RepID=A0A848DS44_9PSEU|nr:hypothetical protein [Pseudonocardia bannensis]NMH95323.1 hypothetical protein [Pseudonocardia bannensis]